MTTYANPSDIEERYEDTIPPELQGKLDTWIESAETFLTAYLPQLDERIANGLTVADAVKEVVCNIVIRRLRNPGGFRSESVGDASYTRDAGSASARMFLTREDRTLLGLRPRPVTVPLDDEALPVLAVQASTIEDYPWRASWGDTP